jgi:hypothetical protein
LGVPGRYKRVRMVRIWKYREKKKNMELFSYHQTLQLLKPIQALPLSLEEYDL